ncbi:MAG: hypothetical protein ACAH95_06765 [Fimbriimonas sp.]
MSHVSALLTAKNLVMVLVAIIGSLFFGASLSTSVGSEALGSALWLTICAGLGWAALIPALVQISRIPLHEILTDCLVSICFGEAVLAVGAVMNWTHLVSGIPANALIVLCSNIVMAGVLAARLQRRAFPVWKTLIVWILVLDGVGALAFWLLGFLLQWSGR